MKTNNIYYNNFNLLRLFAALQVSYKHIVDHLELSNTLVLSIRDIISIFPGVPIFFLISGYLITMSYEKNQDMSTYIQNRFLRIIPGLYASVFISLLILWYFKQFSGVAFLDILPWLLAQLTIFQFYNPEFIRDFGVGVINGSLWTISIELVFYMILPLLFIFLQKKFYKKFIFLFIVSLGFYYYINNISSNVEIYEKLIACSILPYLFYFLLGLYVYRNFFWLKKYIEGKIWFYLILYLILNYFTVNFENNFLYLVIVQLVFTFFVFSFIFSYRTISFKLMKHYDFTYGIYIYHMLLVNIFIELGYVKEWKYLLYILVMTVICGFLSYFLVEKPFLLRKTKSLFNDLTKGEK